MVYRPKWYSSKNNIKYPYPTGIKKHEMIIIDTRMVLKQDDTSPKLVSTLGICVSTTKRLSTTTFCGE